MINLTAGDSRPLDVILRRDGDVISLTGSTVVFFMDNQDGGDALTGACSLVSTTDPDTGASIKAARYAWQAGDTDTPGLYYAQWRITNGTGQVETVPDAGYDTIRIQARLE